MTAPPSIISWMSWPRAEWRRNDQILSSFPWSESALAFEDEMSWALLFGRYNLLVKMGFALGDRKERVCQAQLVPPNALASTAFYWLPPWDSFQLRKDTALQVAAKSQELTSHTHTLQGSIRPVMIWNKQINISSFFNFRSENSKAWPTPVPFNWNIMQMTGGILHFLVATLFKVNRWN